MHVQFVGEPDDGICVSSHHAGALRSLGMEISFAGGTCGVQVETSRPDVIHLVTFEQLSNELLRQLVAARIAGTQIIRYWSGRDLVWARHHEPSKEFAQALAALGVVQLCRSADIAEGLGDLEIAAKVLPVISANISSTADPQSLPQQFTVLAYLPDYRSDFHGGDVVEALIRSLPLVRFLILGGAGSRLADVPNVEWLEYCTDSVRAIHRSTVVIDPRLDAGLSRIALEGLCHGRHVVAGYRLPHAFEARSTEDFLQAIRAVRENPYYNLDGRSFVWHEHEFHAAAKALRREVEDAVEPGRLNLVLEGGLRGAAATLKSPQLLSPHSFPLPGAADLPEEAYALKALLSGLQQLDPALAVLS